MVEFLNKDKAFAEIVEIVSKAESKLVLISPYIKIPDDLLERLKYMDGKGIRTVVICRGKDLHAEEKSKLKQLTNLELRFDDDLHAKCFYNEKSMVITSLNLLESSERKNREMGVLLSSEEDANVFNEALGEAEFIVSRAKKDSVIRSLVGGVVREAKSVADFSTKDDLRKTKIPIRTKQIGFCIRCGAGISYNDKRPYCDNCFSSSYIPPTNAYAIEFYCYACGKRRSITRRKPFCASCYSQKQ